jgi:hypothetical protein
VCVCVCVCVCGAWSMHFSAEGGIVDKLSLRYEIHISLWCDF